MTFDFCAVLLYLPTWDEWIEIYIYNNNNKKEKYLPSWDEWIYKQDVGMHLAFLFSSLFSY